MSAPSNAVFNILNPQIATYLEHLAGQTDPLEAALAEHAKTREFPLIGKTSGRWLELLTTMIGGKRVFEFGSGFGFSAFYFARAVGEHGSVLGSDFDAHERVDFEKLYGSHPFRTRIDIQIGSAFDIFDATEGHFDVILIDIDKEGYPEALEAAVPRVRSGGLIMADNVLWGGRTASDLEEDDTATAALQTFNQMLYTHPQLLTGVIPVGDGLSVSLVK
jgi:predicted O-methyltransferase YrrM